MFNRLNEINDGHSKQSVDGNDNERNGHSQSFRPIFVLEIFSAERYLLSFSIKLHCILFILLFLSLKFAEASHESSVLR
jgi:hypothetical protein